MRGSVAVLGPLLARTGRAEVSQPGGCVIGVRPIDLHLKGMRALGARIEVEHGYVVAEAPRGGLRRRPSCTSAAPRAPTVLGTTNVMMAALPRARAHRDPRRRLRARGRRPRRVPGRDGRDASRGLGSPRIEIEGVERLHGATHAVIPDRIEAGTFVVAGAMTGGDVRVEGCRPDHLRVAARPPGGSAACRSSVGDDWIETAPYDPRDPARCAPTDVTTLPYPGFPTDLQAQWMALMTLADGMSVITEQIYPDRYMHVAELDAHGRAASAARARPRSSQGGAARSPARA